MRPAWAEIDLAAIAHNVAALREHVAPARLGAVVKADGYGHGAVEVARAALAAGADGLGVALVEEGAQLRAAGIDAPVLLLSQPPLDEMRDVVELDLRPTLYTAAGIDAAADAVAAAGPDVAPLAVHLKVDTGMHRVGADPADAVALATRLASRPELCFEGLLTHCAVADEPDNPFTDEQLGALRRGAAGAGRRRPRAGRGPRRELRGRARCDPTPASTSCAAASPSTASSPRPASTVGSTSGRPWRSRPGCPT